MKTSIVALVFLAVAFGGSSARGESESLYRSGLFTVGPSLFKVGKQESLSFEELEKRKRDGAKAAIVKRDDTFYITLSLSLVQGERHPCPSDDGAECQISLKFVDAESAVHLGLLRKYFMDTRETDRRLAVIFGFDGLFSVGGRIPAKAAIGAGVIAISISVPISPNPVFSYRIPVIVE